MSKVFKYQSYLDKYKNCPKDCEEKDTTAYRWVHEETTINDFFPVNIAPNIPRKELSDNDRMCVHYALSLFKDAESAVSQYLKYYDKQDSPSRRLKYVKDKGSWAAKVNITENDGVCEEPNNTGHFNFFEYEACNLFLSISEKLDIFVHNGSVK